MSTVVEHLDVLEGCVRQIDSGPPLLAIERLDLRSGPAKLDPGIIQPSPDIPKDGSRPAERI